MPPPKRTIRRIQTSKAGDFDDQLWPINCALLILAGFVTGIVIAVSDFRDPRLLYSGWVRLLGVAVTLGLLFWGVIWLQGKMLRRLQLCLLLSLLAHLCLAVYLHQRYLALAAQWDTRPPQEVIEQYERIVVPDYYWQQIEQPHATQSFEEPIETEVPRPTDPEALRREARQPDLPAQTPATHQPEVPERQQPNPLVSRRAELPAPRRADAAAGAQISRQPLADVPIPNQPIPEPAIALQPRQAAAVPDATTAPRPRETLQFRQDAALDQPALAGIGRPTEPEPARASARRIDPLEQSVDAEPSRPRPSPPPRAQRDADMASSAAAEQPLPAAGPAAAGGMPAVPEAAVLRSAREPSVAGQTAGGPTAELAGGSARPLAPAGEPRAIGMAGSAAAEAASVPRLARAAAPMAQAASSALAQSGPPTANAADAQRGGSQVAALNIRDPAARRGGTTRPLAAEPAIGAGPAGFSGTPGPVAIAQDSRVTRHESIAQAASGGGTPTPGRTLGAAVSPELVAEPIELAVAASGSGRVAEAAAWDLRLDGPRSSSGPPARFEDQPSAADTRWPADGGGPIAAVGAPRAVAWPQDAPGGRDLDAQWGAAINRTAIPADLPAADAATGEPASTGAAGTAEAQDGLPNLLRTGPSSVVRQAAADLPAGRSASAVAAESVVGNAVAAVAVAVQPRALVGQRPESGAGSKVAPLGPASAVARPITAAATIQAEPAGQPPTGQSAAEPLELATSLMGERSRPQGGLPVRIAAPEGPGGLGYLPLPEVGIPTIRARPESDAIHTVFRRFVIQRSGGDAAVDGRVREGPADAFQLRDPGRRADAVQAWGGTEITEKAVEMGLDYFARHQFPDGHWSLHELPEGVREPDPALGEMQSDSAATGLALLSFLGAGYTHQEDKYRGVVGGGIGWLLAHQKDDGDLFAGGTKYARFYSHAIAAIALCEAYGMTRDAKLRGPARRAIEHVVRTQHATRGGWRYDVLPETGRCAETDTSVTGWMLMALISARMAGLEVPQEALDKIDAWLDTAEASGAAGQYVYNPFAMDTPEQRAGRQPNLPMTAEAMLMRMYLGYGRDDPGLVAGARHLQANLPGVGTQSDPRRDCYYWYYATQAMFHMQEDYWTAWNDRLRPLLTGTQVQSGPQAGSWHPIEPVEDRWGRSAGRNYVTALNLLMLEVYYRHLPLFRQLGSEY